MIEITMQNGGTIRIELDKTAAPITGENFEKLASKGFYDGLTFHRVIPGFMIQGGGYDLSFTQKNTNSINGEFQSNGFENNLKHERGVLSMARNSNPNSASSQFFIMHRDASYLDGEYAAFAKLTEGYDVLDTLAGAETGYLSNGMADVPVIPQVIKTIRLAEE